MNYVGRIQVRRIYWSPEQGRNRVTVACDEIFKHWFMIEHSLGTWDRKKFHKWVSQQIKKGVLKPVAHGEN